MKSKTSFLIAVAVTCSLLAVAPSWAQIQLTSQDGKSTMNLGFLSQLQYEGLDNADASHMGENLFFRRLRLIAGGKINDDLTFFVETDSPNLGKGTTAGTKTASTVTIQDFFLTYSFSNEFKLDGGMLLVPVSHNSQQSAASLLLLDYGPYSFQHSSPLDSVVGRDYGLQARGYLANNHVEYRLAVLQGNRGTASTLPFRTTARVVWYPFEADTGFFYSGSTLGKKQILAIGGSYDQQKNYKAYSGDVFLDQPVGGGNALTLQADYTNYDGGTTFTKLPKQKALLFEGGFYIAGAKASPIVQFSKLNYDTETATFEDQQKIAGGVAVWLNGHRNNLKVLVEQIKQDKAKDRMQYVVQWQVFTF
jgi:Phosphate-selective porin O and P